MFPSPHGVISISTKGPERIACQSHGFRPLTGLSLYLQYQYKKQPQFFPMFPSPHGVISISTDGQTLLHKYQLSFPSPHGVISISTNLHHSRSNIKCHVSVPSRGYLYIYRSLITRYAGSTICFRPLTGLSLYLHDTEKSVINGQLKFPSPHGVISISTLSLLSR